MREPVEEPWFWSGTYTVRTNLRCGAVPVDRDAPGRPVPVLHLVGNTCRSSFRETSSGVTPEPLSRAAITSLLRESLPGRRQAGLLETLAYSLHKSTMGYPLFVQQTLLYLLSSGRLARSVSGEWALEEPLPGLPPSVEAVLHARIDALPGELRLGLLLAGLLGRSFSGTSSCTSTNPSPGPTAIRSSRASRRPDSCRSRPAVHFRGSLLARPPRDCSRRATPGRCTERRGLPARGRNPGPDETLALETAGHLAGAGRYEEAMPWALTALTRWWQRPTARRSPASGNAADMAKETKDTGSERRINMAAFDIHSMRGDFREARISTMSGAGGGSAELARLDLAKARIHAEKGQTLEAVALLERILSEYGVDGP